MAAPFVPVEQDSAPTRTTLGTGRAVTLDPVTASPRIEESVTVEGSAPVEVVPPVATPRSGDRFPRTLVVTSHLPPSRGGVQSFTDQLVRRLPHESVIVMAPEEPGCEDFDRAFPVEVVRYPGRLITSPTFVPRLLGIVRRQRTEAAWITSAMPLGLSSIPLRRAGVGSIVVSTHGMEIGWASVRPTAAIMRRVTRSIDTVTYLGDYMQERLAPGMRNGIAQVKLTGGVDSVRFQPDPARRRLRAELGLGEDPVVVIASRLVPRKGHDVLIAAWPEICARHPRARLLGIGDGRRRADLERMVHESSLQDHLRFVGTVTDGDLAAYLSVGDVFALPCRDVWRGLQVEGLGLSILEASSVGLPVVVGRSGGSPDAVQDGVTGHLVDGRSPSDVAGAINHLFDDPERARAMGRAGRAWAQQAWSWDELALDLADTLAGAHRAVSVG